MNAPHTLRITAVLLVSCLPFITCATSDAPVWSWTCDSTKETCSRVSGKNSSSALLYPSIETCRLVCGKYGALWPRPTGTTTINRDLLRFSPDNIHVTLFMKAGEAKQLLQDATQVFLQTLPAGAMACPDPTAVHVNVTVADADSTDLRWSTGEDYALSTANGAVTIVAGTVFGARHALETLSQLIELYPSSGGACLVTPSQVSVADKPVYAHRGLLLDSARNFLPVNVIKRHIEAMAAAKMNVLHWHVTDSQSFPLELPSLPNMTRYGAYSTAKIYHTEDVQELLYFAKVRGIRIVIEIDGPSHAGNGWQWGPAAGLGNLALCINQAPYRSYCIEPPCGQLNPINSNLYPVLEAVYGDLVHLIPNGDVFHMGGDEVFIPCWNASEDIIQYLNQQGKPRTTDTFLDLWADFQSRALHAFDAVATTANTSIVLWTSHLTDPSVIQKYLAKERYVIQTWVPTADELPAHLLALGYRLIISTKDAWYLDHGFWGSTVYYNWQKVYNNKILKDTGVLGGEVCMWGEYVDGTSVIPRTWPRAAAAAERLWSDPSTNSNQAQYRFYRHRERLVARGINADAVVPRWCYHNEGAC